MKTHVTSKYSLTINIWIFFGEEIKNVFAKYTIKRNGLKGFTQINDV